MVGNNYDLFTNNNPTGCPIISCSISGGGSYILIATSYPWAVEALDNVYALETFSVTMTC